MRLLIVTQVVDSEDPTLGFFHRWLTEFGERCERVTVICLFEGVHALPSNVRVLSLGKENGWGTYSYVTRFFRYMWRERKHYDAVFVHMNPEYVVLGAPLWRLMRKRVGLWYTHKSVTVWLRLATWFADIIFTASKESFRIPSSKVRIVGHGIDTRSFSPGAVATERKRCIVTVGRITRSKNSMGVIDVAKHVREQCSDIELRIVGSAVTDIDREYERACRAYAEQQGFDPERVFVGGLPHERVVEVLHQASVFVSMSETGSLDKAVLEAMACGVPVVTTNEAGRQIIAHIVPECLVTSEDDVVRVVRVVSEWSSEKRSQVASALALEVAENHSLKRLIPILLHHMIP